MTNMEIVRDLKVIIQDYQTRNGGAHPAALSEAVKIIEALPETKEEKTADDYFEQIMKGEFY